MHKFKTLSLILLLVSITGIMVGSGGFTTVSGERGASIDIVNDESAYVGYQSSDLTVQNGKTIDLVIITNRAPDNIDVTDITIEDGDFTITDPTTPTDISPGENGTIRGTAVCTPSETQAIRLSVTVNGSDVTAQLAGDTKTRNFTLTCASGEEDRTSTGTLHDARYNGGGNFEVNATDVGTTEIVYWTADKKWTKGNVAFTKRTSSEFDSSQKLQPNLKGNTGIVAVYFPKYDVTFVHPNYYDGNWGAGNANQVSGKYNPRGGSP